MSQDITNFTLDDSALPPPTPEIEQERNIAIFDLLHVPIGVWHGTAAVADNDVARTVAELYRDIRQRRDHRVYPALCPVSQGRAGILYCL